jgi:hypothetical protein
MLAFMASISWRLRFRVAASIALRRILHCHDMTRCIAERGFGCNPSKNRDNGNPSAAALLQQELLQGSTLGSLGPESSYEPLH